MRISDWSSDVCSSDLPHVPVRTWRLRFSEIMIMDWGGVVGTWRTSACLLSHSTAILASHRPCNLPRAAMRSEEHTSELQSLMRISYAVFCLKKKIQYMTNYQPEKHTDIHNNNHTTHN